MKSFSERGWSDAYHQPDFVDWSARTKNCYTFKCPFARTLLIPEAESLVACDPSQVQTLCVPIQRGQGLLKYGSLVDGDGNRAMIATQVEGVLAAAVNTDELPEPPYDLSGRVATYTGGRFLWRTVRNGLSFLTRFRSIPSKLMGSLSNRPCRAS